MNVVYNLYIQAKMWWDMVDKLLQTSDKLFFAYLYIFLELSLCSKAVFYILGQERSRKWTDVWRVFLPISSQCSVTILPGNNRKPLFFGCFQMAETLNIGLKLVKLNLYVMSFYEDKILDYTWMIAWMILILITPEWLLEIG